MKKTTKKQAREIYDRFHGVLLNLNGGTIKENEAMAEKCFEELKQWADKAEIAAENPSKPLRDDAQLFKMLKALPERRKAFGKRYGFID